MFKRFLATAALGGLLLAASVGAASALQVNGPDGDTFTEQAGVAADFSCDDDGVTAFVSGVELDDQTVRNLEVQGIDPACNGATLGYKVANAAGGQLAQGDATITGTSMSIPVGAIPIAQIEQIVLVIIG